MQDEQQDKVGNESQEDSEKAAASMDGEASENVHNIQGEITPNDNEKKAGNDVTDKDDNFPQNAKKDKRENWFQTTKAGNILALVGIVVTIFIAFIPGVICNKKENKSSELIKNDEVFLQLVDFKTIRFAPDTTLAMSYGLKSFGESTIRVLEGRIVGGVTRGEDIMPYMQLRFERFTGTPSIVYIDKGVTPDFVYISPRKIYKSLYDSISAGKYNFQLFGYYRYESLTTQEQKRFYFKVQIRNSLTAYQVIDSETVPGDSTLDY